MISVAFLDVGQGDSTVIQLPDERSVIIIDCPSRPVTLNYLRENKLEQLSAVYISHSDSDHAGGIVDLLRNYGIVQTNLYFNLDTFRESKKLLLRKLLKVVEGQGISLSPLYQGTVHQQQTVEVAVLHPTYPELLAAINTNRPNDASVLLRVEYGTKCILLTADISARGWQNIFQRDETLAADILKFPHHGAWETTVPEMLDRVEPELIILSAGSRNPYSHPNLETLKHLYSRSSTFRFVCTEATAHCHTALTEMRTSQPCAGTIIVTIDETGEMDVKPSLHDHQIVITTFDQPQCQS